MSIVLFFQASTVFTFGLLYVSFGERAFGDRSEPFGGRIKVDGTDSERHG